MLKVVTLLFADLVGSTARADALHPEDFRALIQEYFDAMADEIRAEGGTIEKYVGDEIMAIFGVPTAREDDAVRAVRAARRMLERRVETDSRWSSPVRATRSVRPSRRSVGCMLSSGRMTSSCACVSA